MGTTAVVLPLSQKHDSSLMEQEEIIDVVTSSSTSLEVSPTLQESPPPTTKKVETSSSSSISAVLPQKKEVQEGRLQVLNGRNHVTKNNLHDSQNGTRKGTDTQGYRWWSLYQDSKDLILLSQNQKL